MISDKGFPSHPPFYSSFLDFFHTVMGSSCSHRLSPPVFTDEGRGVAILLGTDWDQRSNHDGQ